MRVAPPPTEELDVRRLVPDGRGVALEDCYADLDPPAAGWVAIGMVTSVDGAVAVDGVSGALGGDGDLAAFRGLRSLADVVVVGAGTAIAEDYRATIPPRHVVARRRRGQADAPRLALVTGSGQLDPDARVFADPASPPLVLTTDRGAAEATRRGVAAELVALTDGDRVAPDEAVRHLRDRRMPRIVLEGGPTMNAAWLGGDVVDELFVTVAPTLVGGDGVGIAGPLDEPVPMTLLELRLHQGELVLRYRVGPRGYRPGDDGGGAS